MIGSSIAGGRTRLLVGLLGVALAGTGYAQSAPPSGAPGPSPSRLAIDSRRAAFTLIGVNFRPFGAFLKGGALDSADAQKRAARLIFLAGLLDEDFPDVSNVGQPDTKAKRELWANRPDFDKKLKALQTDTAALVDVGLREKGPTDAYKAAVASVGQDCKSCHDSYRDQ